MAGIALQTRACPGLNARPADLRIRSATVALWRRAGRVAWTARGRIGWTLVLLLLALLLLHQADHSVMDWLASRRTPAMVHAAKLVSTLGELHVLPLAVLLALWGWVEAARRFRHRLTVGAATLALASCGVAAQLLKWIIGRPRPNVRAPDQLAWFHSGWDSFPSGHSMHWATLLAVCWTFSPRLAYALSPLALVVMVARVLVPRHYPTDILGGFVLGAVLGLIFGLAARDLMLETEKTSPAPTA